MRLAREAVPRSKDVREGRLTWIGRGGCQGHQALRGKADANGEAGATADAAPALQVQWRIERRVLSRSTEDWRCWCSCSSAGARLPAGSDRGRTPRGVALDLRPLGVAEARAEGGVFPGTDSQVLRHGILPFMVREAVVQRQERRRSPSKMADCNVDATVGKDGLALGPMRERRRARGARDPCACAISATSAQSAPRAAQLAPLSSSRSPWFRPSFVARYPSTVGTWRSQQAWPRKPRVMEIEDAAAIACPARRAGAGSPRDVSRARPRSPPERSARRADDFFDAAGAPISPLRRLGSC